MRLMASILRSRTIGRPFVLLLGAVLIAAPLGHVAPARAMAPAVPASVHGVSSPVPCGDNHCPTASPCRALDARLDGPALRSPLTQVQPVLHAAPPCIAVAPLARATLQRVAVPYGPQPGAAPYLLTGRLRL